MYFSLARKERHPIASALKSYKDGKSSLHNLRCKVEKALVISDDTVFVSMYHGALMAFGAFLNSHGHNIHHDDITIEMVKDFKRYVGNLEMCTVEFKQDHLRYAEAIRSLVSERVHAKNFYNFCIDIAFNEFGGLAGDYRIQEYVDALIQSLESDEPFLESSTDHVEKILLDFWFDLRMVTAQTDRQWVKKYLEQLKPTAYMDSLSRFMFNLIREFRDGKIDMRRLDRSIRKELSLIAGRLFRFKELDIFRRIVGIYLDINEIGISTEERVLKALAFCGSMKTCDEKVYKYVSTHIHNGSPITIDNVGMVLLEMTWGGLLSSQALRARVREVIRNPKSAR